MVYGAKEYLSRSFLKMNVKGELQGKTTRTYKTTGNTPPCGHAETLKLRKKYAKTKSTITLDTRRNRRETQE